jgi:hypothetical protein
MRKIPLLIVLLTMLLATFGANQSLYAQSKIRNTEEWRALLAKGKQMRKTGIILTGVGLGLIGICAILPQAEPRPGDFLRISAGQFITAFGGTALTLGGLITTLAGAVRIGRAKAGLESISYHLHPRHSIQGTALTMTWKLGK